MRRWAAARLAEEPALPSLVTLGKEIGVPVEAAVALASVFELTEACLERPLQAECCCSSILSADERAVLLLLGCGSLPQAPGASPVVPHGLPGALAWAVRIAGGLLGLAQEAPTDEVLRCPFGARGRAGP